ncbi:MAG: hypothetical protein WCC30_07560 [Candidatus Dormiibacterota bacterium]
MSRKSVALLVLFSPLLLLGCGGNSQQGYLAQSNASAQFLQVTRNGSNLSGNLQSASISSSDPTTVTTFNASFTGTTDGTAITLTFPQGLGFATSISGSYSGDHIQLSVPQSDGTLSTEDFAPSDTNAYNTAVQALHQQAQQAQADQQAATAAQQQAQQEADQRAAVDKAISAVNSDFTQVTNDINSYKSLYASVNSDEQQGYKDTVTTYNDLKKVQSEGSGNSNCGVDANTVAVDANTVAVDQNTVEVDQNSEQVDVQSINGDISRLDADFQKFQSATAAIPSYQPSGQPTSAQISQDHTAASNANSQADAMIAAALKQLQTWVTQANQYATSASAICG